MHDINEDECVECGLCFTTFPDIFLQDDCGSILVIDKVSQEHVEICPTGAIIGDE